MATTIQILALDDYDSELLAQFMGHDLAVHKKFYRLPSGPLILARLSKLFSILDRGKIVKGQKLNLTDVGVSADEEVEIKEDDMAEEADEEKDVDSRTETTTNNKKHSKRKATDFDSNFEEQTGKESACNAPRPPRKNQKPSDKMA